METILNIEPAQRPNPLNDYLFYRVMGEKGDEIQLLGFLNAVLGRSGKEQINSVEILENRSFLREIANGKSCILDLLAVLQNGTRVNIEVQLANQNNIDRRSLYYWGKVYVESLGKGENYRNLPDVIAVNIVNFDFPRRGGFHTCFHLREDSDPAHVLTSALEIHYVNMVRWRKQERKDMAGDPLHRWLAWFDEKSPPELIEEIIMMDSAIRIADAKHAFVMQDEEAYQTYWMRQKAQWDMNSRLDDARQEGLKQGEADEKMKIARKMKEMGLPIVQIAKVTGFSPEAIEKI